uniref:Uncharacterized protein n=1 Tax=virus sp. ctqEG8 TaxID=2827998 RepID=A0A8S5RFR0_9VIRU|nr:MAG TPA: hypothetical protein [virus sp. ctqEG8]
MKKTIEQLREYARRENVAYKRLENAGYVCWGDSKTPAKGVIIERYLDGKSWKTNFPDERYYFEDFSSAAKSLLHV